MTFENDPNRRVDDPYVRRPVVQDDSFGWGIPLGVAAVVLIAGLIFFNSASDRTTTASNDTPVTSQTRPAPAPITPAPAPLPTPPKQ